MGGAKAVKATGWVPHPSLPPATLPCTLPPAGAWTSAPLCLPQSPEPTPYLHPPLQQAGLGMGGEAPPSTPAAAPNQCLM